MMQVYELLDSIGNLLAAAQATGATQKTQGRQLLLDPHQQHI
jgi:hypothetical protein